MKSSPRFDWPPIERELFELAIDLARRAGEVTLPWFRSANLRVEHKTDGSPVTEADRAAERFLRAELMKLYPTDTIVGEEEGVTQGTSERRWYIDPIDGTKAFVRGVPLYSTLLAVEDSGGSAVGVICLPALGEVVAAGRGLGCFWNGVPARVSDRDRIEGACLVTSGFDGWPESMLLGAARSGCLLRTWGDGYGYALVATGRAEAMVDTVVSRWDLAPMPVIFREAGGRFTALDGQDGIDRGSGLATNGRLHDAILQALGPW